MIVAVVAVVLAVAGSNPALAIQCASNFVVRSGQNFQSLGSGAVQCPSNMNRCVRFESGGSFKQSGRDMPFNATLSGCAGDGNCSATCPSELVNRVRDGLGRISSGGSTVGDITQTCIAACCAGDNCDQRGVTTLRAENPTLNTPTTQSGGAVMAMTSQSADGGGVGGGGGANNGGGTATANSVVAVVMATAQAMLVARSSV